MVNGPGDEPGPEGTRHDSAGCDGCDRIDNGAESPCAGGPESRGPDVVDGRVRRDHPEVRSARVGDPTRDAAWAGPCGASAPRRLLHDHAALGLVNALEGFLHRDSPRRGGERLLKRGAGLGAEFLGAHDVHALSVDLRVSAGLAQ